MKIDEVRELENEILKRLNRAYMSPLDHGRLTLALLDYYELRERADGTLLEQMDSRAAVEKLLEEM